MNATRAASAPLHWGRITAAGVLAPILSLVTLFLVISGYAAQIAIQARGKPDAAQIAQFADHLARWAGPFLTSLLALAGATVVARTVRARAPLHGALVGLVAALCLLLLDLAFAHGLRPTGVLAIVLTLGAGWLGGLLGGLVRVDGGGQGAAAADPPRSQAST
jgi:putative membrane protein (TIGR04086 family)